CRTRPMAGTESGCAGEATTRAEASAAADSAIQRGASVSRRRRPVAAIVGVRSLDGSSTGRGAGAPKTKRKSRGPNDGHRSLARRGYHEGRPRRRAPYSQAPGALSHAGDERLGFGAALPRSGRETAVTALQPQGNCEADPCSRGPGRQVRSALPRLEVR